MQLLIILVCHLHLELILESLCSILLVGCVGMVVLEMSLHLAVRWRSLKAVDMFLIRKRDVIFANNWGTASLLLMIALVLLLLKHIIYLTHVILAYLSVVCVTLGH